MEELWRRIQQGMGYSDEEVALVRGDPYRRRVLEAGPILVRTRIVGEVVEAKNCAAHSVGAKYVIRGNGVVRTKECSESLCISLLALMAPIARTVFDRIASGQDPKDICEYIHCPDVGVECGGFGKAILKVTVE